MWISEAVSSRSFVSEFSKIQHNAFCRRKSCCHPFIAGDVFRYMSVLIKLSNHLGLILPGEQPEPSRSTPWAHVSKARTTPLSRYDNSPLLGFIWQAVCRPPGTAYWRKLLSQKEIYRNMALPWCNPNTVENGLWVSKSNISNQYWWHYLTGSWGSTQRMA